MSSKQRRSALTKAESAAVQEDIGPCGSCSTVERRRVATGPYAGLCLRCAGKARADRRSARPCVDCGAPALKGARRFPRHRCKVCDDAFCEKARRSQTRKTGPCPSCAERARHVDNNGNVKTYCDQCGDAKQRANWRKNRSKHYGKQIEKLYGIKYEEYLSLLSDQEGICPLCLKAIEDGKNSVVDHCHDTGAVRGVLHRKCNVAIGMLEDDPSSLRRAAEYIENGGVARR